MTAAEVVSCARTAGLTLEVVGDRLRWRGPTPTARLLDGLRAHKPEVLALLSGQPLADADTDAPELRAEPPLHPLGTSEREAADRSQAEMVTGLLHGRELHRRLG